MQGQRVLLCCWSLAGLGSLYQDDSPELVVLNSEEMGPCPQLLWAVLVDAQVGLLSALPQLWVEVDYLAV